MNVIIFGSQHPSAPLSQVFHIVELIEQTSTKAWIESSFLNFLLASGYKRNKIERFHKADCLQSEIGSGETIAISIGGDGTYLRTAFKIVQLDIPILGVNIGRLGFLAATSASIFEKAWTEILEGQYGIVERSMLKVEIEQEGKRSNFTSTALNEVVVSKKDTGSMVRVDAFIDEEKIASYEADGLIVATPTGSTAYSLSVNGPIISPSVPALCITPVAPHTLNMRPLVVSDSANIHLRVSSRNGTFLLTSDGRNCSLRSGTEIIIRKSETRLRSLQVHGYSFFSTLRDKLLWGIDTRNNE